MSEAKTDGATANDAKSDDAKSDHETLDFAAMLDALPNMAFVNYEGRLVFANRRCVEVMGYGRQELLEAGFDFRRLVAPRSHPTVEHALARHCAGEQLAPYEYTALTRDGREIDVIQATRLVPYGSGTAILAVLTDISARKVLEQALQRSEGRYRSLIEACPDAIAVLDLEAKIQMANEQMARICHVAAPDELIGLSAYALVAPEDLAGATAQQALTVKTGAVSRVSYSLLRPDGTRVPVEVNASLIRETTDEAGFVCVVRDISEHKELLAAKRELSAAVIAAQEQERRWIARELHDGVGQMLVVLGLEAGWLADNAAHAEAPARAAALRSSAQQTLDLVREMSQGLRPSVLDDLGIGCALDSLARDVGRRTGLRCQAAVSAPIDQPAELVTAIYRVAQEALTNVVRHAAASRAWVHLDQEGHTLTLTVEDDGAGIGETAGEGPTLGVAHMRERTELLDGSLVLEPREPSGTRLRATFSAKGRR